MVGGREIQHITAWGCATQQGVASLHPEKGLHTGVAASSRVQIVCLTWLLIVLAIIEGLSARKVCKGGAGGRGQFSLPHLYVSLLKVGRMSFF